MLRSLSPMLATPASALPSGPAWTYEVKWDGYRTLALKDGPRVRLLTRNLKDATRQYPTIARAVSSLAADQVLLNGEAMAVDENGRPSFQALHHGAAHAIVYCAFDLLYLGGQSFIERPLEERRARLADILAGSPIWRSEALPGTPEHIEQAVRQLGLEGVVAKRWDSRYEPGRRSRAWLKVRFNRRQEFVVGGYKPSASSFESLLVGYFGGKRLLFASKVRSGLTPHVRAELFRQLLPLTADKYPFANLPSGKTGHWAEGITAEDMTKLRWVQPRLVVEVAFVEWTRDGCCAIRDSSR